MRQSSLAFRVASALAVASVLAACGGGDDPAVPPDGSAPRACADMVGLTIPAAAIGLPTTGGKVTSATVVPLSGTGARVVPEHCLVGGTIAPVDPAAEAIQFRVALPVAWNRKAMMFGGGGFNGPKPEMRLAPVPREVKHPLYHRDYRSDYPLGDDPYRYYRW